MTNPEIIPDPNADTLAMLAAEADADAGRMVPHREVAAWLDTWGTAVDRAPPNSWFE
jgi:hypothetical protein